MPVQVHEGDSFDLAASPASLQREAKRVRQNAKDSSSDLAKYGNEGFYLLNSQTQASSVLPSVANSRQLL